MTCNEVEVAHIAHLAKQHLAVRQLMVHHTTRQCSHALLSAQPALHKPSRPLRRVKVRLQHDTSGQQE